MAQQSTFSITSSNITNLVQSNYSVEKVNITSNSYFSTPPSRENSYFPTPPSRENSYTLTPKLERNNYYTLKSPSILSNNKSLSKLEGNSYILTPLSATPLSVTNSYIITPESIYSVVSKNTSTEFTILKLNNIEEKEFNSLSKVLSSKKEVNLSFIQDIISNGKQGENLSAKFNSVAAPSSTTPLLGQNNNDECCCAIL